MQTSALERDRLLTVDEAAERIGVHRATVHRWVHDGQLPAIQPGGPGHTVRISERELLRSQRREEASNHKPGGPHAN
jgi:excisionase family DNA binding protein